MSLDEMIDNIADGQMAKATLYGEVWYVLKMGKELYYCDRHGNIKKLAEVNYRNVKAEWELL